MRPDEAAPFRIRTADTPRGGGSTPSASAPSVPIRLSRIISSLRARGRQLNTASKVSLRPSRCSPPVRPAQARAARRAPAAGSGGRLEQARQAADQRIGAALAPLDAARGELRGLLSGHELTRAIWRAEIDSPDGRLTR